MSDKLLQQQGLGQDDRENSQFSEKGRRINDTDYSEEDTLAVLSLRNLLFDMCNQNGGGHGGSAIGMAAIGVALWKYIMRHNPSNPEWFDRDRFVLSNGHAVMLLYALNYLVGYDAWTMEQLKGYGSPKPKGYKTMAYGHPERESPGIEVTTGPLGQGIANAVGLAMASKQLAARYNRPGYDIVKARIYCMTGDGCLMEGVALEAITLAGSLKLDNLVLIYDNNHITCDGPLEWTNTEDINAKMRASGWDVIDVQDGNYDVQAIVAALNHASSLRGKPVMINIRTVIGVDTESAGTAKAHHSLIDVESIRLSKIRAGQDPSSTHSVPEQALVFFRERKTFGERLEANWNILIQKYETAHPDTGTKFRNQRAGIDPTPCLKALSDMSSLGFDGKATRESNGAVMSKIWELHPGVFAGGADLVNSNKIPYTESDIFHPSVSYSGRFVRYGIREHAMAGIANGLAAYNEGTFLPITATFFMFYLYAAPSVRMGALSRLPVIHIATHDSFAEGQNGPTHQPVELDSLYRAMPSFTYIRPCDGEEVIGAWKVALANRDGPTMLSLGRDPVGPVPATDRYKVALGAYIIQDLPNPKLVLVSSGTNLHYTVSAAKHMSAAGTPTRVVSAPCLRLFDAQSQEYRDKILPRDGTPVVSIEEYVATTWARYTTASIGMTGFGCSAAKECNYERFGLDTDGIIKRLTLYLADLKGANARGVGWRQL
ncbi:transketolase, putative [Talaromyces stipitatus ATCC 10500]|uniref:Transketolase, putative n=1 Tax=Talaromyces stipitatus (strain ATCC 10500 / CBS 375.48 / QM 6759 / NRRL 1006) TaxID=441959 RepID=B8M3Z5_TALSN|nr:transketolase, putative [Talaromyces stipitatus ATCC 10500]EED20738.1 transketolase, putative [Talaromyces stipitatus ATCC 10500]